MTMFTAKSTFLDVFSAMTADDQQTLVKELSDASKYAAHKRVLTQEARDNLSYIVGDLTDAEKDYIAKHILDHYILSKHTDITLIEELERRGYEVTKPSD